jgi:hypothetical protein
VAKHLCSKQETLVSLPSMCVVGREKSKIHHKTKQQIKTQPVETGGMAVECLPNKCKFKS